MKKYLLQFLLLALSLLTISFACDSFANSFELTKNGIKYTCTSNGTSTEKSCSPNCLFRDSSGKCSVWGSDFCAPNANCSENCLYRNDQGICSTYASDFCGTDAVCTPNCLFRDSNGVCKVYGSDSCEKN